MIVAKRKPPVRSKGKVAEANRVKSSVANRDLRVTGWRASYPSAFTRHCLRRFVENRCLVAASALSYSTIVSLIPLTAIVLAIFSGFSVFSDARTRFLDLILANFAPDIGATAAGWFQYLATNAAKTTVIGGVALVITSILLLATIENELQIIWRVPHRRAWYRRIFAYWIALTLGPVLLGVALSLPGYLDKLSEGAGGSVVLVEHATANWLATFDRVVSFVIEAFIFTLLYCLIPNCPVRIREGIAGAVLAAVVMEVLKTAFTFFVTRFSSYGTVYGALAGIPIFLLWMYIFWAVVLFGAEVAAGLGHRRAEESVDGR